MTIDDITGNTFLPEPGVTVRGRTLIFAIDNRGYSSPELVLTDETGGERQRIRLQVHPLLPALSTAVVEPEKTPFEAYYYEDRGRRFPDPHTEQIRGGLCFLRTTAPVVPVSGKRPVLDDMVIYKLHIKGFTAAAPGRDPDRGTFRGLVSRLSYIRELGFNTIEMMPFYAFDDRLGDGRRNYWGYAVRNCYLAPQDAYAASDDPAAELHSLITAIHQEGMACLTEICFPAGTPAAEAVRVARFWHERYDIDGFRFLGAGVPERALREDIRLSRAVLLFEQADRADLGRTEAGMPRRIGLENGAFRHCLRAFLKGTPGSAGAALAAMTNDGGTAVTICDMANVNGMTLYDAVSYDRKHNEINGEHNADGPDNDNSWNCGVEGPTRNSAVLALRKRLIKNALAFVLLSPGVPLLYAGDERGNSQNGCNNAYASDDPVGWVSWRRTALSAELTAFTKRLTAVRRSLDLPGLIRDRSGKLAGGMPRLSVHGREAWYRSGDDETPAFALMYAVDEESWFYAAFNSSPEPFDFALPIPPEGMAWQRLLSTDEASCPETGEADPDLTDQRRFCAAPRCVTILTIGRRKEESCH